MPQQTYTVAIECEPETIYVFPFFFSEVHKYVSLVYCSFFDWLYFQTNLKCIKNLSVTVAIVGFQTIKSMPTHLGEHTPNVVVVSYYSLAIFISAYVEHKRLVTPLMRLSQSSNFS